MNEQELKSDYPESFEPNFMSAKARKIPVEFTIDLPLCYPVKNQSLHPMSHSTPIPEKPLVPALFQIAARADDLQSMPKLKNVLMTSGISTADRMLDAEKLEAILKAVAQKRKQVMRRELPGHIDKRISADTDRIV